MLFLNLNLKKIFLLISISDINECTAGSDICVKSKSDCVNSAGGYKCQCKKGYSARGDFLCEGKLTMKIYINTITSFSNHA